MPAPTALQRRPEELAEDDITMEASAVPLPADDDAELVDMSIEPASTPTHAEAAQAPTEDTPMTDETGRPKFPPAKSIPLAFRRDQRKVPIPPHRMTPLKTAWPKIFPPLVEHLQLQVRMNLKSKAVELRTSSSTTDTGALQKGQDFLQAFCLGFDVDDAIALLRLDDLYIQSFEVRDVKSLSGEHLGRAIGRIAGRPNHNTILLITYMDIRQRWQDEIRDRLASHTSFKQWKANETKQRMRPGLELC
jgi:RNA-binding protein PNO1